MPLPLICTKWIVIGSKGSTEGRGRILIKESLDLKEFAVAHRKSMDVELGKQYKQKKENKESYITDNNEAISPRRGRIFSLAF